MSIGKKMLLGGMALILLPLTVVGYYAYQISSDALARLGQERVSQVADLASGELGEAVQGKIDLVKEISMGNTMIKFAGILLEKGEDVSGPEYKAVEEKFKRFMASLGQDLQSLYVTGKKGRVLVDSRENKGRGTDLSGRKYFQEIMQGRDLALAAVFAKTTGKPVLVVGVPIKNAQGDLAGMMAAIVKLEAWSEKILKNKLGRTGYVFVLDEDGLVVIHPDPETIMKVNLGELDGTRALVGKMKKLEAGLDDYEYNGVSKIAGFSTIPVTGWKVVACQNSHEFWEFIREIRNGVILAGLLFSVLAVPLVVCFARRISKPLARAAKVADGVAAGDLTRRLDVNAKGEIGALAGSINAMAEALEQKSVLAEAIANGIFTRRVVLASDRDTLGQALLKMVGNLSDTISEVQQTVKQVAVGADQISESSQALSQGATEQAASLEEITSSLNEIGSQTTTNAENAAQANQLAETVRSAADTGNSRMAGVITAMGEINSASKEIAKIIKTIDDIAFQTNLLALNAAVEAARAGRHGKGFAVVAQEVRNLAGRSAKAAQETEELIEGTVRKVQTGSDIVGQTAEALEQIRGGVMKMADLTGEIAAASREQAAGIKQINQGLGQIDQVTQQNTANAEETASASQELSDQAERLRKTLEERFKVRKKRQRDDSKEDRAERVPAPKRIAAPETHRGRGDWTEERKTKASQGQALDPDAVISLDDDEFGRY